MLWVLKITISMRWFFLASEPHVLTDLQENNFNFTLKKILLIWTYDLYKRYIQSIAIEIAISRLKKHLI